MALGMDWDVVEHRLEELRGLERLSSTIDAMSRVVTRMRQDPAFEDTERGVSHASIRVGYPGIAPFVLITWSEKEGYAVSLWDADDEVHDRCVVSEMDVGTMVQRRLRKLVERHRRAAETWMLED